MKMTACHPLARFIYALIYNNVPAGTVSRLVNSVLAMGDKKYEQEDFLIHYAMRIGEILTADRSHVCSECEDEERHEIQPGPAHCGGMEIPVAKVRINPGACVKCPFFHSDDISCNSCNLDGGPDKIACYDIISPLCPLRIRDVVVFLREDQRTE